MDNAPFRHWLQSKNYSSSTIRNYIVDLNKYFDFCSVQVDPSQKSDEYKNLPLQDYLSFISSDPNYRRYLSSLNKFFEFALDQKLIDHNPLKPALKNISHPKSEIQNLDSMISTFQTHLQARHTALSTIRNYINDLKQYITWVETQTPHET